LNKPQESTRSRLLRIQRDLAESAKQEIGWNSGDLAEIESIYHKSTSLPFKPASFEDLIDSALNSNLVFIGDYHTLRESQKTPLRVAGRLLSRNRSLVFCTEAFHIDDQPFIERWQKQEIDDSELLEKTDWNSKWGFPWRNFGMQMHYFRERDIPIIALNSHEKIVGTSFAARDRIAAMRLVEVLREHPESTLLVSFGDLHMAPDHLPREVDLVLKSTGRETVPSTILHQNVDHIYWELAQSGLEQSVSTVRLEDGSYCFMGTTPLVKIQSALNWYSNESELEESIGLDLPPTISSSVMNDQIWLIIETLCEFLEVPAEQFQDFSVYTSRNLDLIDHLSGDRKLTESEIRIVQEQYEREESCYLPRPRLIFLGNLSMRHAAEEASHHINFVMCGDSHDSTSPADHFYEVTIRESLGFLGTKVMDHNRKPLGEAEIRRVLEDLDSGLTHPFHAETRESLLATQRFIESVKRGQKPDSSVILPADANEEVISGTAHLIGYLLGNWIYSALMAGKLSRGQIRSLFSESLSEPESGARLFDQWLDRVSDQS
jgi:hypothetical protein